MVPATYHIHQYVFSMGSLYEGETSGMSIARWLHKKRLIDHLPQGLSVTVIPSRVKLAGRQLHVSNLPQDSKLCSHSESHYFFMLCACVNYFIAGDNYEAV